MNNILKNIADEDSADVGVAWMKTKAIRWKWQWMKTRQHMLKNKENKYIEDYYWWN